MANEKGQDYVTRTQMELANLRVKKDLSEHIQVIDNKFDEKFNDLNLFVKLMAEGNKAIQNNTERTADSIEEFTKEQKKTNDGFDKRISGVESNKSHSTKLTVTLITSISIIVVALFELAPLLIN